MKPAILTLLLTGVFSLPGLSATPGGWSAVLGFGDVVPGAWAALTLTVPPAAGPWSVEVRSVLVSGRETDPVVWDQPAGGSFEHPVYLTDAARTLKLRFLAGGLVQDEINLPLAARLFPGHLVGASGVAPRARAVLADVLLPKEPVRVVEAPPATWPTSPLSYGGLAALVVADPGPVLSPAQRTALRAWIGSGGRLVVVAPRETGSLLGQVGEVPGWGRVSATAATDDLAAWRTLLNLEPYGTSRRLGTDFDPPAIHLPGRGTPAAPGGMALLALWAGATALVLVLRKTKGLGPGLVTAALATAAVIALGTTGALAWDQGLPLHSRELLLPGDLGRFTSLDAIPETHRGGPFEWSSGSPWALANWKAGRNSEAMVETTGPERVTLTSYQPSVDRVDRVARYRIRWEPTGLRWSENTGTGWVDREEAPAELDADRPWLARMAAGLPGTVWSVGLEGTTCWLRPEPERSRP